MDRVRGSVAVFGRRIDASIRSLGQVPCHRYESMALCGSQRADLRIGLRCDVRFEAGSTQEVSAVVRLGVQSDCVTRGRRWKSSAAFNREPLAKAAIDRICGSIATSAPHGALIDGSFGVGSLVGPDANGSSQPLSSRGGVLSDATNESMDARMRWRTIQAMMRLRCATYSVGTDSRLLNQPHLNTDSSMPVRSHVRRVRICRGRP